MKRVADDGATDNEVHNDGIVDNISADDRSMSDGVLDNMATDDGYCRRWLRQRWGCG